MKKSIKKIVSLLATATIVFSSVSALAAPKGWTTTLDISGQYWNDTVNEINKTTNPVDAFKIYDFGGNIQNLNNARTNFNVTYETKGGRSYMKLVPKDNSTLIEGVTQFEVVGGLYKKIGKSTGRSHFTFEFAIDDTGIKNRAGGQNSMHLRLNGESGHYALFAGTGWSQGTACVGVGNYDCQWAGNEKNVAYVKAGTWCRYYVDYDRYTNKMVVGIKNADTEKDLVGPTTVAMTEDPYLDIQSALPSYNNATYYIGEMKYWKDTFVCDNASKAITADDTTVTAKVDMANDVGKQLAWYSYGNATWEDHTNTSEPMLILAQYDANDHFLGLTSKPLTGLLDRDKDSEGGDGERKLHEMSVSMNKADGYAYAKAFLWDSMSGLDAFSDAWTNK